MALECINGTTIPIVDVTKKAKELFLLQFEYSGWAGMCPAFCTALKSFNLSESIDPEEVSNFISLFNRNVAEDMFEADGQRLFWWSRPDMRPRVQYFDWLIEQYSKEI